jgi:hypothetical protein
MSAALGLLRRSIKSECENLSSTASACDDCDAGADIPPDCADVGRRWGDKGWLGAFEEGGDEVVDDSPLFPPNDEKNEMIPTPQSLFCSGDTTSVGPGPPAVGNATDIPRTVDGAMPELLFPRDDDGADMDCGAPSVVVSATAAAATGADGAESLRCMRGGTGTLSSDA